MTLSVSKGPTTVEVPDVTGLDLASARQTLRAAGFKVTVTTSDTEDESLDGLVASQSPLGRHAGRGRLDGGDRGVAVRAAAGDDGDHDDRGGRDRRQLPVSPRLRVAVLAGGRSSEHEISLASAASIAAALDPERYDVHTIEIGRDGRWELPRAADTRELAAGPAETLPVPTDGSPATLAAFDVVFVALHGPFGEDGTVQGLLELANVPYVGPGRARLGAVHGQGRLQAGDAGTGDTGRPSRRAAAR